MGRRKKQQKGAPEKSSIETFENLYPKRAYWIEITCPEYTSVCPRTGLPDFGTIHIRYIPGRLCLELRSLKFYLMSFRNVGIFYETVVNQILDDILAACRPVRAEVVGTFSVRGGISTVVKATYPEGSSARASSPSE